MDVDGLTAFVAERFSTIADPDKAGPMAAYMKTDMPFYGVQAAPRVQIVRDVVGRFPPVDRSDYRLAVLTLWNQPHREEKCVAIEYARAFPSFVTDHRDQLSGLSYREATKHLDL